MRCYLVTGPGMERYAGTRADTTTTRNSIVEERGCKKNHVTISEAEIPTAKAELLEFVNNLVSKLDQKE